MDTDPCPPLAPRARPSSSSSSRPLFTRAASAEDALRPLGANYGALASCDAQSDNGVGKETDRPPPPPLWDYVRVIAGASLVAAVSGTTHAFNVIQDDIRLSEGLSTETAGLLNGVGVAGLFVSILAGRISDRAGTVAAAVVGGALLVLSYLIFSISSSFPALLASYVFVGIGSGSTYQAALQTAVVLGRDWGVGLVAVCMSFSINLTVDLHAYLSATYCDDNTRLVCWRYYIRVYAIIITCMVTVGACLMIGYKRHLPPPAPSRPRAASFSRLLSITAALAIFRRKYFWTLLLSNIVALGSAIFVVSSLFGDTGLWADFHRQAAPEISADTVLLLFSILNAFGNVCAPIVSNFLHVRGFVRIHRFLAGLVAFQAVVYVLLSLLGCVYGNHAHQGGPPLVRGLYYCLLSFTGLGFGSFLTLFPMALADAYGHDNFGSFMSFMQAGVVLFAIGIPAAAAFCKAHFNTYYPFHALLCVCLWLACGGLWVSDPPSDSYATVPHTAKSLWGLLRALCRGGREAKAAAGPPLASAVLVGINEADVVSVCDELSSRHSVQGDGSVSGYSARSHSHTLALR